MKKENITIETSSKDFNDNLQKVKTLKEKIEKEIIEIDKIYDDINKKLRKLFELKIERLIKEENDLRDNLQNEVTKVKEKLEIFLSQLNNVIKTNEKINKGIQKLRKDDDKSIIKSLTYVSKINKNKNEIQKILQQLMRNIKINLDEKESKIKFDEYYFSGIQTPINIEIKDINDNLEINWKIDDKNFINIDKNKMEYIVELRKENEKFNQFYKGNKTNCIIENLNKNINYEIRICCIFEGLVGPWSQIQKIKIIDYSYNVDSIILDESKRKNEFLKQIFEWHNFKKLELIYRGTRDGTTGSAFHNKCDNKGPTITIYRNEKGNIMGAYSPISWTTDGRWHKAKDCFIFTLSNIHGTSPTKFNNIDSKDSVYHDKDRGPCFQDIHIYEDFKKKVYSSFPNYYQDVLGKGKSIFTGDLNNNNNYFKMSEIEVFSVQ